jgi:hypothetical protein
MIPAALIEYTSDFPATIPNVVIFQFNPEQLERTIEIPPRPTGPTALESDQAGDPPIETISFTAKFDAADRLARNQPIARTFGIGTALSALQQMANPRSTLIEAITAAVDHVGDNVATPNSTDIPVPRVRYPRVLFVWGVYRILPVAITGLSITETKFDFLLNPTQADVNLTLSVIQPNRCSIDPLMTGAAGYSDTARELQAAINIGEAGYETVLDITRALGG